VHRARDAGELREIIQKVRGSYKTPLIVSTVENPISYQKLLPIVD